MFSTCLFSNTGGQELKKGDEDRDGDPGEKDAKDKANEEMRDNKNEEGRFH